MLHGVLWLDMKNAFVLKYVLQTVLGPVFEGNSLIGVYTGRDVLVTERRIEIPTADGGTTRVYAEMPIGNIYLATMATILLAFLNLLAPDVYPRPRSTSEPLVGPTSPIASASQEATKAKKPPRDPQAPAVLPQPTQSASSASSSSSTSSTSGASAPLPN